MPRVKIDYVVSFSSEDPDNPASNLLAWDVSKKRWLCAKGEPSCSVVLQLPRAVKISAVHIGAHQAALVEVLVGRSEKPHEPFQVLVPSCIFLTPAESRRDAGAGRVRSFSAGQLSAARDQRWDRVRVVCSQPYNKHIKYGLNFVQIMEPEGASAAPPAPARWLALLAEADMSSDDDFSPGELFAKLKSPAADTGAQIRQATSQALKNISDSATKLVKTPIPKHTQRQTTDSQPSSSNRQRDALLYNDDDGRPHAKIDHIVQRHKDEKSRDESKKLAEKHDRKTCVRDTSKDLRESLGDKHKDKNETTPKGDTKDRPDPVSRVPKAEPSTSSSQDNSDKDRKRSHDDNKQPKKVDEDFNGILKGVVFVLSGYVNPERASIREKALEMGARCERDWGPQCNFLICAFPNTPKLKQVRSGPGGAGVPAARGAWVAQCHRLRRRVPWRWFATEPQHARPPGDLAPGAGDDGDGDECDTDDEIEKNLRQQKKRRHRSPSSSSDEQDSSKRAKGDEDAASTSRSNDADKSYSSDVMLVRDERLQGNVTVDDSDDEKTDEENGDEGAVRIDTSKALPDLFAGRTFVLAGAPAALAARYVAAYGGVLRDASQLDADSSVDYVLSTDAEINPAPAALVLRPDWLWRCHETQALHPVQDYLLT